MEQDTKRPASSWLIWGAIIGAIVVGLRWLSAQPDHDFEEAANNGPYQLGLAVCAVILIAGLILRGQERKD